MKMALVNGLPLLPLILIYIDEWFETRYEPPKAYGVHLKTDAFVFICLFLIVCGLLLGILWYSNHLDAWDYMKKTRHYDVVIRDGSGELLYLAFIVMIVGQWLAHNNERENGYCIHFRDSAFLSIFLFTFLSGFWIGTILLACL